LLKFKVKIKKKLISTEMKLLINNSKKITYPWQWKNRNWNNFIKGLENI